MDKNQDYAKIFFILSIVGLVFVWFIYMSFVPEKIVVANVSLDELNRVVAVEGAATAVVKSKFNREFHDGVFCLCMRNETHAHFTLRDETGEIMIYLRDSDAYIPASDEKVKVVGKVGYWFGVVIFAERVEKVKNNA